MVINYLFGVIHAAVTYFYGVSVEDFSELVIGCKFLALIDKHFPKDHKLRKIQH